MLQDDEGEKESHHSIEASTYFENFGQMFHELILYFNYLYQSCKLCQSDKLVYLSNTGESSQFVNIPLINKFVKGNH